MIEAIRIGAKELTSARNDTYVVSLSLNNIRFRTSVGVSNELRRARGVEVKLYNVQEKTP